MIALATNFSLFSLSHFLTSCFLFLFLIKKSTNSYNFFLIFSQRTLSISLLHTHLLLFSFLLSFVLCDLRFYCTNFVIIFIRNTQTPIVCMGSRFLLCFSLVLDSTAFFLLYSVWQVQAKMKKVFATSFSFVIVILFYYCFVFGRNAPLLYIWNRLYAICFLSMQSVFMYDSCFTP